MHLFVCVCELTSTNENRLTSILFLDCGMKIWTTLFDSLTKRYARLNVVAIHIIG